MKLAILAIFCVAVGATSILKAEDPPTACHKCQVIREENKKKVNPYEYYEDYLQDNGKQADKKQQPQPKQNRQNRQNGKTE